MARDMGTMSLIVAMSMESELVAQFFPCAFAFRSDVINFILILGAES